MLIKIRFNTDTIKNPEADLPEWRVILEGQEFQAREIRILTSSWTTKDLIEEGLWKWHITTEGIPEWDSEQRSLTIRPE